MKKINCKKFGFTLAEVLITLGLIGVVAAMTMPTLIKNYKKHVTETRLKQTYSILSQAFYMAQAKSGEFREWDRTNGKTFFDTYWRPYLKVGKDCTTDRCGYKSLRNTNIFYHANGTIKDTSFEYHPQSRYGVVLSNGVFIFFITQTRADSRDINENYIDINYTQGPNTLGKDVFLFKYTAEGIKPYGYASDDITQKNDCKTNGQFCSALIMKNGWKIPNNYPVKF